MASITTRAGKGSPLTHAEVDANFNNLNSGKLDISTAPAGSITVDSSGRLGIGTSSPVDKLHVDGRIAVTTDSSTPTTGEAFFYKSSSGAVVSGFNASLETGSAGSRQERLRIDSSGRLLVGTSSASASALLTVQGSPSGAAFAANINIQRGEAATSITADESIGQINFGDSSSNLFASINCSADANAGTNDYPGRLEFSTTADGASSPTERMRLDNKGTFSVFSSTANVIGAASNQAAGTTYYLFYGSNNSSSTTTGTTCFLVYTNGNVQNTNNSYAGISDIKLKENIVDASSQWSDIKALQVRNYNFKEGQTHTQIGLVAQEVELVSPGLVTESPDRDEDGNDLGTVTKSVNYSVLYMKAVKALQEAMERIETLEAKVAALEASS